VRWRGLGDALHPLRHEFGLLDALGMGTTLADDGEALARALWALAPTLAEATGFRPNDARRPLVQADGAGRLAQRLQQPQRAA
jgi:hypothetical protein